MYSVGTSVPKYSGLYNVKFKKKNNKKETLQPDDDKITKPLDVFLGKLKSLGLLELGIITGYYDFQANWEVRKTVIDTLTEKIKENMEIKKDNEKKNQEDDGSTLYESDLNTCAVFTLYAKAVVTAIALKKRSSSMNTSILFPKTFDSQKK
jgi:hypothetical protein